MQKRSPTKRAPDAGDSVASYGCFCAASLFLVGRLRRPQPPAQVTQTVGRSATSNKEKTFQMVFVTQKKSIFSSLITAIFLAVFSGGCISESAPMAETSIPITPTISQTDIAPSSTKTIIAPTETTSSTLELSNVNYFDLTSAERIEQSQTFVEQANNFSGEIGVPVEINRKTYHFFWNPTAVDKYETDFVGGWKPDGSSDNLDKLGETLPDLVIAGYENPDGSLVVVNSVTGQQTVYTNPNIPALGGAISYRDLYKLPQSQLAIMVTQEALRDTDFSGNLGIVENINALKDQSYYLPVILYGEQTSVFANGATGGNGPAMDLPEERYSAYQVPTNNALVPIYSPETSDFMFFINIMSGNPVSVYTVFYSPDGKTDSRSVVNKNDLSFGKNSKDDFGIIAQSNSRISHYLGGGDVFIENSNVVGEIDVIEAILRAQLEEEIFSTLNQYRLLVTYPSIVYRPER